jgi:hypothetical protein
VTGEHAIRALLRDAYERETARSGGVWRSLVTLAGDDSRHRPVQHRPVQHRPVRHRPVQHRPVVDDRADEVVGAASVNKLGIACAVLDLVDRGELSLGLTSDRIRPASCCRCCAQTTDSTTGSGVT